MLKQIVAVLLWLNVIALGWLMAFKVVEIWPSGAVWIVFLFMALALSGMVDKDTDHAKKVK